MHVLIAPADSPKRVLFREGGRGGVLAPVYCPLSFLGGGEERVYVHIVRISAKVGDVVSHPLKGGALVLDAIETSGSKVRGLVL